MNKFIKNIDDKISMIKKQLLILLALTILTTTAFGYGGSGSGFLFLSERTSDTEEFNFSSITYKDEYNLSIDCEDNKYKLTKNDFIIIKDFDCGPITELEFDTQDLYYVELYYNNESLYLKANSMYQGLFNVIIDNNSYQLESGKLFNLNKDEVIIEELEYIEDLVGEQIKTTEELEQEEGPEEEEPEEDKNIFMRFITWFFSWFKSIEK